MGEFPAVLKGYWVDLVKLNLIFVVLCLPVVTIPGALCALCRGIYRMQQGEDVRVFRDFLRDLRRDGIRALAPGGVTILGLVGAVGGLWYCAGHLAAGGVALPLLVALLLLLYASFSVGMYTIPMTAILELPMEAIFKNGCILALLRLKHNVLAFVLVLLLTGFVVLTSPFTFPLVLCTHVSLCALISMSCARDGLARCAKGKRE